MCVQYVYLKVSIVQLSTVQGIVYVCTSWRVHTAHCQIPQVLSLHHVLYHINIYTGLYMCAFT